MPKIAADAVMYHTTKRKFILVKRKYHPHKGCWAIPGGMIEDNETVFDAMIREMGEETQIETIMSSMFFKFYDDPLRDSRSRIISFVYFNVVEGTYRAGDDAADIYGFSLAEIESMIKKNVLAFDHGKILSDVIENSLEGVISYV